MAATKHQLRSLLPKDITGWFGGEGVASHPELYNH